MNSSWASSLGSTGHHMICVTSQWLHRAANLSLPGAGLPFTTSVAAKTRLLLRRSTSHALLKHIAEVHTSQPAINPPSEDRRLLLPLSIYFTWYHLSQLLFSSRPSHLHKRPVAPSWQARARCALYQIWLWRASQKGNRDMPWRSFHCELREERRGFQQSFYFHLW